MGYTFKTNNNKAFKQINKIYNPKNCIKYVNANYYVN